MRVATPMDIRKVTFRFKRNLFTGKILYDGDQVDEFPSYVEVSLRALETPVAEYVNAKRGGLA